MVSLLRREPAIFNHLLFSFIVFLFDFWGRVFHSVLQFTHALTDAKTISVHCTHEVARIRENNLYM